MAGLARARAQSRPDAVSDTATIDDAAAWSAKKRTFSRFGCRAAQDGRQ
jgi:hypothetical protein